MITLLGETGVPPARRGMFLYSTMTTDGAEDYNNRPSLYDGIVIRLNYF